MIIETSVDQALGFPISYSLSNLWKLERERGYCKVGLIRSTFVAHGSDMFQSAIDSPICFQYEYGRRMVLDILFDKPARKPVSHPGPDSN